MCDPFFVYSPASGRGAYQPDDAIKIRPFASRINRARKYVKRLSLQRAAGA